MWELESGERESIGGRDHPHHQHHQQHQYGGGALSTTTSNGGGLANDGFEQRGQSWFATTDIPSDLLVQIGDVNFHLHKYPLISRSGKLNRLIYESGGNNGGGDRVILDDLPGGPDAFELAAKFCYGIAVDLTASNISGLRCASEYLEMTEDLEEGNLIFKTEAFLSYVVLSSWRDSIVVLKSCEHLSPWAENLQIVRRCSESIAWKACANPKGIRWAYTGKPPKGSVSSSPKWHNTNNSTASATNPTDHHHHHYNHQHHHSSPSRSQSHSQAAAANHHQVPPPDWWFEDVSILRIDHYVRVVTAIKVKGMRADLIGASIMHYASKWLPGLVNNSNTPENPHPPPPMMTAAAGGSWKKDGGLHMIVVGGGDKNQDDDYHNHNHNHNHHHHHSQQARDQRMIIESLISIIPPQKDSVTCSFLLRLLRMASMLRVAPALVTELEKRVGMQFEQATLADLLVPCYHSEVNNHDIMNNNNTTDQTTTTTTMYDVDLMRRLLEHFLVQEQTAAEASSPSPSRPDSSLLSSDKGNNNNNNNNNNSVMLHELLANRSDSGGGRGGGNNNNNNSTSKARVARIVDSYLTEVAKDRNLSLTKFLVLAETLPESARSCDDGLYRAIDSYLKTHPTLSEHERKRLCRVMDCQKLSVDACMHAAQNERLPLRVVVQVLLSEQVKISNAIANTTLNEAAATIGGGGGGGMALALALAPPNQYPINIPNRRTLLEGAPQSFQEGWAGAKKDINTLKFELETVKTKYVELQNEMESLHRQFDKLAKQTGGSTNKMVTHPPPPPTPSPHSSSSAWATGWKKLSKLTKMNVTAEGHVGVGSYAPNEHQHQHSRKTTRRWRNSIS